MSWEQLSGQATSVLQDSPVESERFGLRVARMVVPSSGTPEEVRGLLGQTAAEVVVLRHPADRIDLAGELLGHGWTLLPADTLVYWRLQAGGARRRPVPEGMVVSTTATPDPGELEQLVESSFDGYPGHYRANPLLDPDLVTAGYVDWVRRTVGAGDLVTVWDDGRLGGFLTTQVEGDHLELVLAGVDRRSRGRGTYAQLIGASEEVAARHGVPWIVTSTQAPNTVVQRSWARLGFEPVSAFSTVHLVREPLLARAPSP